jgi:hypothetical protein
MPRLNLLSSAIKLVDYDSTTQSLEVELTTGRAYRYLDVPPSVFGALLAAKSKGRFYNDHIRDVFLYVRLR